MPRKVVTKYMIIEAVWYISSTHEIVAADESQTTSFPNSELNDFITAGDKYFCRKSVKSLSFVYDSFELALFHKVPHKIS